MLAPHAYSVAAPMPEIAAAVFSGRISAPLRVLSIFPLGAACYTCAGDERNLDLRYYFADCVLDTDRRELRRRSSLVAVEPRFRSSCSLDATSRTGRHKDDLLASVSHRRIGYESALANRINAAGVRRRMQATEQRLIKILPRRGVQFCRSRS